MMAFLYAGEVSGSSLVHAVILETLKMYTYNNNLANDLNYPNIEIRGNALSLI